MQDLKLKKYAAAQLNINQSIRGPITDLVATLLSGWAIYGSGDTKAAVASVDKLTGPEWYPIFKDLHAGMMLDLAGKEKDAGIRFERAYKLDDSMLRVAESYARWLSRNKDDAAASGIYEAFDKKLAAAPDRAGGAARDQGRQENAAAGGIRRRPAPPKRYTASAPR